MPAPQSQDVVPGADHDNTAAGPGQPNRAAYGALSVALLLIRLGPVLILLGLCAIAASLTEVFLTPQNLGNVLAQSAVIAIVAIGQLLVILTRGVDLSVGSTVALASVVGALVHDKGQGQPGAVVILAMLGAGIAVGVVNGIAYVWGRIPHPFVVTLATLSIVRGLALALSGGQPVREMPSEIRTLGSRSVRWLPHSTYLVVGVALVIALLTTRLVWGRWIYAVGGNPEAARRTGIPVKGVLISVYILSGLLAGVAALVSSARLNAGSPTSGTLLELDSIAAVVIGGASFLGGRGNVANALVGALMIGVIRNAMNLVIVGDSSQYLQPIVIGVVIVIAVETDVMRTWLEGRIRIAQAIRS